MINPMLRTFREKRTRDLRAPMGLAAGLLVGPLCLRHFPRRAGATLVCERVYVDGKVRKRLTL